MIFMVGGVVLNWWVWSVPDCDFQKVEGMSLMDWLTGVGHSWKCSVSVFCVNGFADFVTRNIDF